MHEEEDSTIEQLKEQFPFTAFMTVKLQNEDDDALVDLFSGNENKSDIFLKAKEYWSTVEALFDQIGKLVALETIRDEQQQLSYIVNSHSQFILATNDYIIKNLIAIQESSFTFSSLVLLNAQAMEEVDLLILALGIRPAQLKRVILTGVNIE